MEKNEKNIIFGIILGLSFLGAAFILSNTFVRVKNFDNLISVSGSAKQEVVSDSARWTAGFSRNVLASDLKNGYALMKADEKIVSDFLSSKGLSDNYEISPVFMYEVYKMDQNSAKEYSLVQNIEVKSNDVEKMKAVVKEVEDIVAQGVIFSSNPVEYYYSKLPELRVSLLPEALRDAGQRANAIADSSGAKVGSVKSVSMGVVQVMPVGSIQVSDYGSYDTSSINKEVMITVKSTFRLK